MTVNAWSPRMERNIGMCLVSNALVAGDRVSVEMPDGRHVAGTMCELPFL
jgi:glycine cleavage system aminomethyltransferase T